MTKGIYTSEEKVCQFIKHMRSSNWIFKERFDEQDYTFDTPEDVEVLCKEILLEQAFCRLVTQHEEGDSITQYGFEAADIDLEEEVFAEKYERQITPEQLVKLFEVEDFSLLIPHMPYVNLFLHICAWWAELQANIWPGIGASASKGVIELGEHMIDALMKVQEVDKIKDLGMDT